MRAKLGVLKGNSNLALAFQRFRAPIVSIPDVPSDHIINLVTTWNSHCGIAAYSAFLTAELKRSAKIRILRIPDHHALSPYFFIFGVRTGKLRDIVHVQFADGIFRGLKIGKKSVDAFSALLFYLGLALGNNPVITTYHEIPKSKSEEGIFRRLLNRVVCQVSDLIIVHNTESKDLLEKLYGIDDSKIRVIPHGCYQNPLFLNKDESKRELGLLGKTVITIPGFITEYKGHDIVLALFPRLEENIHLVFAGEPKTSADKIYCERLRVFAKQHNCSDRVTFAGYFSDISTILNATDIAILPYRFVTDSGILRFLVAYRVPTITSNLRAFKEIQIEYNCIELFQKGNSEDLLAKINYLLSNEEKGRLLLKNCQKMWAATKWSKIAERHVNTYLEVLESFRQR